MTKSKTTPTQIKLSNPENSLINTGEVSGDIFGGGWHFHTDYELVLITKSFGSTLIGDHVGSYSEYNLFLMGPNLPHVLICDKGIDISKAECFVLQFKSELFSRPFLEQPEFGTLKSLLERSELGISFSTEVGVKIKPLFRKLLSATGVDRVIQILNILNICSLQEEQTLLASEGFANGYVPTTDDKLQLIMSYIEKNYKDKIKLEEIAEMANMQENAFCRYFKRKTNMSLFDFINRVRVGNACKFLLKADFSIQEICYLSGYNSSSNFINQFRLRTNMTPKEYRNFYIEKLKL